MKRSSSLEVSATAIIGLADTKAADASAVMMLRRL